MASDKRTREAQYQESLELSERQGLAKLGLMTSHTWQIDPRRLGFVLARYKFVSKMFSGLGSVLEVGCADAMGTRIVQQEVGAVTAIDFDPVFVADVRDRMDSEWTFECFEHDMLDGPVSDGFDGAYSLDVIEHIPVEQETRFVSNMVASLNEHGILILGTPSLESQRHASPASKAGHVNCKTDATLKNLLNPYFRHVFIFSMNDEVVHTGFYAMAHYLFALCCTRR
ncbi:MAG: SAM-dependent methyltransferase [Planctomycetaceae bacterium]|nr:SAM-dependent methyltransferase [Planctomycetaceae bacterium]